MYDRIDIKDFRSLQNQSIILGSNITVISGRNSTGKSTILGMLGNSGELKKGIATTYWGTQFRSEFSEIFKGSEKFDYSGSDRFSIYLSENGSEPSDYRHFRTTWQTVKDGKRFRIIPYRNDDEQKTNAKFELPIIYLGLSRLFPIGEAKGEGIKKNTTKFKSEKHREWFVNAYKEILSLPFDNITDVSNYTISESNKKHGVGINTEKYDYLTNSAGQDNLGQILLSMLSFRHLKESGVLEKFQGLLLIDEVDSTLHPSAQNRLLDFMIKESKAIGYQIVFTTHSTSLLKYISLKTEYNKEERNSIELYYMTNANRTLEVKRNINYCEIEFDLMVQSMVQNPHKIKVYSEDEENRWFIKSLLSKYMPYIELLDVAIGCNSLLTLFKGDPAYFGNMLLSFDGDVKDSDIDKIIGKPLREKANNIVKLPGTVRPEQIVYDYLCQLSPDHPYLSRVSSIGFTLLYFAENGPMSIKYNKYDKERDKYKAWFKDHVALFDSTDLMSFWMHDNKTAVDEYIPRFISSYNSIAKRTFANPIDISV